MTRLLGAVLVAAASAWMGMSASSNLRRRATALEDMAEGLAHLCRELERDNPPLPELMTRLAGACRGSAADLFRGCPAALNGLDQEPFSRAWERLVAERRELGTEGQRALAALGPVLGRCGWEDQRRAAESARDRLSHLSREWEERWQQQGRVCRVLGLSGGAFLVILLL